VINPGGVFSGSLNLNGGTVCNRGTIQQSANININNGTIYNYGTINRSNLNTGSGLSVYNYGYINITGDLNINSGTYWYEDGMTSVGGSIHINSIVTGSADVCGGFQVANQTTLNSNGNVSQIDFCDWGNPASGFDVRNGVVSASVTYCTCTFISNPLPVQLAGFEATCTDGSVEITWTTLSEINNDHFVVEKSTDMNTWETVDVVRGAGNSNETLNYSSKDVSSVSGTVYYRLTQVDVDGTSRTYDPVAADCQVSGKTEISVYPNPSSDYVVLRIAGISGTSAQWSIISMSGTQVSAGQLTTENGTATSQIDLTGMPAGVYIVQLTAENAETQVVRLLVQ